MHVLDILGKEKKKKNPTPGFEETLWSPQSHVSLYLYGIWSGYQPLSIYCLYCTFSKYMIQQLKIKGEPILYLQESYKKYSLVQKVARGLLHI